MASPPPPVIQSGTCHAMLAYDIGMAVDLNRAADRVRETTELETLRHHRRVPEAQEFRPKPLRIFQSGAPLTIAGFSTLPRVECLVFDFGAVSVTYSIPLEGPLDGLIPLSDALYENRALMEDARGRVERLVAALGDAVDKPGMTDLVEDYAVFHLPRIAEGGSPVADASATIAAHRHTLARILRAEPGRLSAQEIDDALVCRIAYEPGGEAIIDWHAAVLFQEEADDIRAVLEFANVELLELRRLDDQLDLVLDRYYQVLSRPRWPLAFRTVPGRELRGIAELQMDSALLFEGVNNALKLVGDQFLARLYRLAAVRMHLPAWEAGILRKLQTAESIYQKLSDQQSTRRMEILEWIIILLIAFEVVMSFVR